MYTRIARYGRIGGMDSKEINLDEMTGTATLKDGSVIDLSDDRYRVYRNGAIYDKHRSRIIAGPGTVDTGHPPSHITTSERAREVVAARHEKAVRAAQEAIINSTPLKNLFAGYEAIIEAQVRLAKDIDQGRASTGAAKLVMQAADLVPSMRGGGDKGKDAGGVTLEMSADVAQRLLDIVEKRRNSPQDEKRDVIDGEFND